MDVREISWQILKGHFCGSMDTEKKISSGSKRKSGNAGVPETFLREPKGMYNVKSSGPSTEPCGT